MRHAAQIVVVGVQAFGLALGTLDFGTFQRRHDRADHTLGDLVLQLEDVVERAFETVGPQMRAGGRVDELPGDANAVRGLADAAFQHVAHAELAADLLHVDGAALVGEAGVARDHEQPADARKRGDDVLDYAVCEVFLLWVAAPVLKWQDRNGRAVGQDQCRRRRFIRFRSAGGRRGALIRRFPDVADKAKPLACEGPDQALLFAIVADRRAGGVDGGASRWIPRQCGPPTRCRAGCPC